MSGTIRKLKKTVEPIEPRLPIVFVPDKTYTDDEDKLIPTDLILVTDPAMYEQLQRVLEAWGKEQMGIPGNRGGIEG
jgi:hypothetical protein